MTSAASLSHTLSLRAQEDETRKADPSQSLPMGRQQKGLFRFWARRETLALRLTSLSLRRLEP